MTEHLSTELRFKETFMQITAEVTYYFKHCRCGTQYIMCLTPAEKKKKIVPAVIGKNNYIQNIFRAKVNQDML